MTHITPYPWQFQAGRLIAARLRDEGYLNTTLLNNSTTVDRIATTIASMIAAEEKRHSKLQPEGDGR